MDCFSEQVHILVVLTNRVAIGPAGIQFGKVRRGYPDGGIIPTVAIISPAYCGVGR